MAYSIRQLADILGVSKSQVARDRAAGMPMHDADAARGWRALQHDVSRTVEGRIDRPSVPAGAAEAGASSASAEPDEPQDGDTTQFRTARAARERTNADRAALELEQLRGRLIDLADAQRLAFTAFRSLRDAVLNVPARVKDQCAAMTDALAIEQLLDAELGTALGGFNPDKVLADSDDDDEAD